jgi:hypothetical protein
VLEKLLEVPTGEGSWRKDGCAVADRWRHRAGSAHASAGSCLLIGDVHSVFKQGEVEGIASHGQRLGSTRAAWQDRVRARAGSTRGAQTPMVLGPCAASGRSASGRGTLGRREAGLRKARVGLGRRGSGRSAARRARGHAGARLDIAFRHCSFRFALV